MHHGGNQVVPFLYTLYFTRHVTWLVRDITSPEKSKRLVAGFARVFENLESPGNIKIWIPGLESPGIFVGVLESPGIWTYRSIFLVISIHEFSHYASSEIWVYFLHVKSSWIHWKGPWIWHSKVLERPRILDVKMCMNPEWVISSFWFKLQA